MSSSSLSMAAASFSFSPLRNKLSNLRFQPITFPTTHFPPKFLYHKTKNHPNFPSFFLISRSIPAIAAAFHEFSVESGEEPDDPLTETETEEVDEEEEEQKVIKQSSEVGRLYVGNLPYAMTSSQLAEVFGEAGPVDNVEIVYDRVTDRSRGFAFVTMGSIEDAKEAIRIFDGSLVGGRTVKVNFPEVPKGGEREVMRPKIRTSNSGFVDTPYKIYVGNLGWGLSSQGLRDAFADQPGFLSAKIIYDRDSGKSRGFGFVSFSSAEQAESALNAMNGVEVEGRPLRLNMAAERARPLSAPVIERTPEKSVDSNEILSSVSI